MKRSRVFHGAKTKLTVFSVLSFVVLCFIFSQSVLSRQESGALSDRIMAFLRPLLDPNGEISEEMFHMLVRKAAHFSEFSALGLCVCGATVNLGVIRGRRYIALPLLITLACAVSDEFLQHFTGRGSMVTDVVIDYSGALFGIGFCALVTCLVGRNRTA